MTDLELALRELDVEWPATPDLAAAVRARLDEPPAPRARGSRRGWRMQLAYVAALLADPVRAARWPSRPTRARPCCAGSGSRASRSARAAAAAAGRARPRRAGDARRAARVRGAGARPGRARRPGRRRYLHAAARRDARRRRCSTPTGPILVQTFRARATPFIEKTIGSGAPARAADRRRRAGVLDQGRARVRVPAPAAAAPTRSSGSRATRCSSSAPTASCCGSRAALSRERAVEIARSVQ